MLKLLIEKELKEILGSTKFVFTFAVCSLLILLTFYVGARNYQINKSQYEASVAESVKSMQDLTSWRSAIPKLSLPPLPMASLVSGVYNDIGRNIDVAGMGELKAVSSRYNDDLIYAVFRFLDLDFLFQIILSLFAILFTFNAINGEKENGTLSLIFSNPVPRDKYILGKLIGSFTALALPLLIPLLLGSLLFSLMGVPMNSTEWLKLFLIIFTGLLYFGVFLCLSVFMSTVMKQSSGSFLLMLVIWILSVVFVPRASVELAGRAVNVPSNDELNAKKTKYALSVSDEMIKKLVDIQSDKSRNLAAEIPKIIEDLNKKVTEYSEKLNVDRANRQDVQSTVALGIARVSPSASFSLAVSNIAGTSLSLTKDYLDQAIAYRTIYKKFQEEKTKNDGGMFSFMGGQANQPKIDLKEMPQFQFRAAQFSNYFSKCIVDWVILIVLNLIFFAGSFFAFLKYDLR